MWSGFRAPATSSRGRGRSAFETDGDRPGAPGNYQTTEDAATFFGVWSIDDNGDVPPRYTIAHDTFMEFRNFAINAKNKEVMMSDKTAQRHLHLLVPRGVGDVHAAHRGALVPRRPGRGGFGGGGGGGR